MGLQTPQPSVLVESTSDSVAVHHNTVTDQLANLPKDVFTSKLISLCGNDINALIDIRQSLFMEAQERADCPGDLMVRRTKSRYKDGDSLESRLAKDCYLLYMFNHGAPASDVVELIPRRKGSHSSSQLPSSSGNLLPTPSLQLQGPASSDNPDGTPGTFLVDQVATLQAQMTSVKALMAKQEQTTSTKQAEMTKDINSLKTKLEDQSRNNSEMVKSQLGDAKKKLHESVKVELKACLDKLNTTQQSCDKMMTVQKTLEAKIKSIEQAFDQSRRSTDTAMVKSKMSLQGLSEKVSDNERYIKNLKDPQHHELTKLKSDVQVIRQNQKEVDRTLHDIGGRTRGGNGVEPQDLALLRTMAGDMKSLKSAHRATACDLTKATEEVQSCRSSLTELRSRVNRTENAIAEVHDHVPRLADVVQSEPQATVRYAAQQPVRQEPFLVGGDAGSEMDLVQDLRMKNQPEPKLSEQPPSHQHAPLQRSGQPVTAVSKASLRGTAQIQQDQAPAGGTGGVKPREKPIPTHFPRDACKLKAARPNQRTRNATGIENGWSKAASPRVKRYFVGNLGLDCTNESLQDHLSDLKVRPTFARCMTTASQDSVCAQINVHPENGDTLESASSWPQGVYIRQWYSKAHKNYKKSQRS